jgi:hypothetical protein
LDGEVVEGIREFIDWGGGRLGVDHQVGIVGLAVSVLALAADFFFVFPASGLVAALDFGLRFLGLTVILLAVPLDCDGASVTG